MEKIKQTHQHKKPIETAKMQDNAHGRKTTWNTFVYAVDAPELKEKWKNLERFIVTEKTVIENQKITSSTAYRISDITTISADEFALGIRGHWAIENKSHWVRDVIFKEDHNQITQHDPAIILAVFNTIAMNFLKEKPNDSIKKNQIIFGQNFKERFNNTRT